jgi:2-phosphosulfolactate phosphatase
MSRTIHVHLLPELIPHGAVDNQSAVIVDVLRASSTIVTAFHNGAAAVIPCGEPDQALLLKNQSGGTLLLGGERGGVRIPGFDLGNSPAEYSPQTVSGRRLAFTTTNGTRALLKCKHATDIAIGCLLNLSALTAWLQRSTRQIHIVCAGTDGIVTGEDVLAAGAMVETLTAHAQSPPTLNDSAALARNALLQTLNGTTSAAETLAQAFADTQGGRNLITIGQHLDLPLCAALNSSTWVPFYDFNTGELRAEQMPVA